MRVLLTGASGQLGTYLLRDAPACELVAWSGTTAGQLFDRELRPVDLADKGQVETAFAEAAPDAVLHCAAISRVDRCFQEPDLAHRVNAQATRQLVELASARRARFVYVSTDMVFDGEKNSPYVEGDVPAPLSRYGQSKLQGEQYVQVVPGSVVARMSLLVGPALHNRRSFFDEQFQALRDNKPLKLFIDEWRTPLDMPTAARALWELVSSDVTGLLHIGGPQRMSRWEIGHALARLLQADMALIKTITHADAPAPEPRPRDLSLNSARWRTLFPDVPWRPWMESLRSSLVG